MAVAQRWRLKPGGPANTLDWRLLSLMSPVGTSRGLTIRFASESSRLREGRRLAQAFAVAVSDDQRVTGVWLSQTDTETMVSIVTDGLDDELEFRLRDIFEALAAELPDPSVGDLFIHDSQQELPPGMPDGEQILATQLVP